ncbi:hypothetical protein Hanom_Chr05g00395101 [Helianthus anomalus]
MPIAPCEMSHKWCNETDLFYSYCLLYRVACTLHYCLAEWLRSAHHWQEWSTLYEGAYITMIARHLGPHLAGNELLANPILLTRLCQKTLAGMHITYDYPIIGLRFRDCNDHIFVPSSCRRSNLLFWNGSSPSMRLTRRMTLLSTDTSHHCHRCRSHMGCLSTLSMFITVICPWLSRRRCRGWIDHHHTRTDFLIRVFRGVSMRWCMLVPRLVRFSRPTCIWTIRSRQVHALR